MKLPRGYSAEVLVKQLRRFGYVETRQTGSHVRLTTDLKGEHHITIPKHKVMKVGTLGSVINSVAKHLEVPRIEVVEKLFKKR